MRIVRKHFLALGSGNGTLNAPFAPVVGRKRELPVVEESVKVLKIVKRRTGAFEHVPTVISPEILFQRVVFARCRHKLPEP